MKKEDVPNKFEVQQLSDDGQLIGFRVGTDPAADSLFMASRKDALILAAWLIKVADSADYPDIVDYVKAAREWR